MRGALAGVGADRIRLSGWRGFAAWAFAGALVFFSILGSASIGLFVLPVALLTALLVARHTSWSPELLGTAAGAGIVCLLVGLLAQGDAACPENGFLSLSRGEAEAGCGGVDASAWSVAGGLLLVLSIAAHAMIRLARRRRPA